MKLPNFLIIGAHKAGTTSLYQYLREHPEIYMPSLKEARYFAYDENNPEHRKKVPDVFPITNWSAYLSLFKNVTNEKAIGEASPGYLNSPIAPLRIKKSIPQVKLIISLRNPVDRAFSLYQMNARIGFEKRPIHQVFQLNEKESWLRETLYYEKVKNFTDLFDRSQIKIILFEDLKYDALMVTKNIFEYLHVDNTFTPDVSVIHNVGGIPKSKFLYTVLSSKKLKKLFKPIAPNIIYTLYDKVRRNNSRTPSRLSTENRAELLCFYYDDILKLQDLLKLDLSHWLKIN